MVRRFLGRHVDIGWRAFRNLTHPNHWIFDEIECEDTRQVEFKEINLLNPTIQHIELSTTHVEKIICDKLAVALDGEALGYAVMSMLTYTCLLLRPDIEFEQLQKTVMETSASLILGLSDPTPDAATN